MARKDSDTRDETSRLEQQAPEHGPASNTSSQQQPAQDEQTGQSTHGLTFTAEGGTPTTASTEFSDSQMVKDGEWKPETHGEPPDARPKRNY